MTTVPTHQMFAEAQRALRRMARDTVNPFSRGTIMEPWTSDFVDVPQIHAVATREIEKLIVRVKKEGKSRARLLIGDSANGKSHVLARTKNQLSDRAFFCFVEPLTGDGDNIFQHILANTVRDLLRTVPGSPHPQFHRVWRDFFLGAARDKHEHKQNFQAWIENRKHDFICLVGGQLKSTGKFIEPGLVGLLYEYVKNFSANSRVRLAIENWLGAKALNEEEMGLVEFPFGSAIDTEDKAKQMINALGMVTHFSRPVFLCFDQVETYILNDKAFRAFMRAVEYIVEYTTNYAVVTAALITFDEKLRTSGLTPSTWDRFNCTATPIVIHPLTPQEGEKLLEARMAAEMGNPGICSKKPLFPFSSEDLDIILTPPGATRRTHKQARYVLQDAELILDKILDRMPGADSVACYFHEDVPLHKYLQAKSHVCEWPDSSTIERFLTARFEEIFAQYRSDSQEIEIDDKRNREIVLDILFRAVSKGIRTKHFQVDTLAVYQQGTHTGGCDFSVTVHRQDGHKPTVGVVCCDRTQSAIIDGMAKKVTQCLKSKAVDELVVIRDSRAAPEEKAGLRLKKLRDRFSKGPYKLVVSDVEPKTLQHLRAMGRLLELASKGEVKMHNPDLDAHYTILPDEVYEYFFNNNSLLVNGIFLTIITGRDHR